MAVLGPLLLAWMVAAGYYATHLFYVDHIESTLVVMAQQWMHGRPMYHRLDSPYLYCVLYGPACLLWLSTLLALCPDPILASKLAGGLMGFATMGLLAWVFRKKWGWPVTLAALGLAAGEFLLFGEYSYCDRPDAILNLGGVLALAALVIGNRRLGSGLIALGLALAIGSKLHGGLYLLPVLAVWGRRHGWATGVAVVTAGVAGSFLFFLLPGISLANYALWLREGARHPLEGSLFQDNLLTLLLTLLPLACLSPVRFRRGGFSEETLLLTALILAGLVVCVPASKTGAGFHHLMPFIPCIAYLFGTALAEVRARSGLLLLAALVGLAYADLNIFHRLHWLCVPANHATVPSRADWKKILAQYPRPDVQAGPGAQPNFDHDAPLLYQNGTPCVLSPGTYMDMQVSGLPPEALRRSLAGEKFRYWLLPQDELPFSMSNFYTGKPLFDDSIRQVFLDHYRKVDTHFHFDVYQAKSLPGPDAR